MWGPGQAYGLAVANAQNECLVNGGCLSDRASLNVYRLSSAGARDNRRHSAWVEGGGLRPSDEWRTLPWACHRGVREDLWCHGVASRSCCVCWRHSEQSPKLREHVDCGTLAHLIGKVADSWASDCYHFIIANGQCQFSRLASCSSLTLVGGLDPN